MDVQSNLYLRIDARVSRVIFEGTKAVGVAYIPSRNRANNAQVQETIVSVISWYTPPTFPSASIGSSPQICRSQLWYSWNTSGISRPIRHVLRAYAIILLDP